MSAMSTGQSSSHAWSRTCVFHSSTNTASCMCFNIPPVRYSLDCRVFVPRTGQDLSRRARLPGCERASERTLAKVKSITLPVRFVMLQKHRVRRNLFVFVAFDKPHIALWWIAFRSLISQHLPNLGEGREQCCVLVGLVPKSRVVHIVSCWAALQHGHHFNLVLLQVRRKSTRKCATRSGDVHIDSPKGRLADLFPCKPQQVGPKTLHLKLLPHPCRCKNKMGQVIKLTPRICRKGWPLTSQMHAECWLHDKNPREKKNR